MKLPDRTGCIEVHVNQTEYIVDPHGRVYLSECATRIEDVNTIITIREIIEDDLLKMKDIVKWMGADQKSTLDNDNERHCANCACWNKVQHIDQCYVCFCFSHFSPRETK